MINDFYYEFNKHIKFLSTSNEKIVEFIFVKICVDLRRRRDYLFFIIKTTHSSHRSRFFLLKNNDVTFSLIKCHFAYSNIKVLNHHVSRLNFNIKKNNDD